MPMHLEALAPVMPSHEELGDACYTMVETASDFYKPVDRLVHLRTRMVDRISGEVIGNFITTIFEDRKANMNRLVDVAIAFASDNTVILQIGGKRGEESPACEHYNATYEGDVEQPLWIETVNRFTAPADLEGEEVEAVLSIFPTNLDVYEDMDALNEAYGMNRPINHPYFQEIGMTNIRYTDNFLGVMDGKNMLFGTVLSFRDVHVEIEEMILDFVLAEVRTTFGPVPVALSRDYFDLEGIHPGSALAMYAVICADLATPGYFRPIPNEPEK